jgi:UDP-glucose 4-epimerase
MRVLVVGGAGYIGSHMCKTLADAGHEVTTCDNLSTGHRDAVRWGEFAHCSLGDSDALNQVFARRRFDAVMHFAANSIVAESVSDPLGYYRNNVAATVMLLETMRRHEVRTFVFSSTAAVYGEPSAEQQELDEASPAAPINPYGRSKLMVEQILSDMARARQLSAVSLRYFNAAGADESGLIGESHTPETHLIPKILRWANGEQIPLKIFGVDYPTPDGTCIRDYVHVNDLSTAHLSALDFLRRNEGFHVFNLGNGNGHSVREVVAAAQEVIGRKLHIPECGRRSGDPARLVANSGKAANELGWSPATTDIRQIIESAWKWHRAPRF